MKAPISTLIPILLSFLISSTAFTQEANVDTVKITNNSKSTSTDSGFDQQGYYTFRPDLRKCMSPVCGGFFVKAVNQKLTRCANGRRQAECYVASLSNKQNFDMSSAVLVQGAIKPKTYPEFGNLGIFAVAAAFSSATETIGKQLFVGLENNGIVCITTPCFSVDQYLLNGKKIRTISAIDLEAVGASDELLGEARSIIDRGEVLIASGVNRQTEEVGGKGVAFVAERFYLPIKAQIK